MSKVQTATDSVLDRVISLSSTATAEDAGYLASALEKTAGSGTIADIQQAGVDAQANLTNLADQKITEIQSLSSNNNSGLGDITVVDSAAIPLVTDESFTENTSAAYRCLVKENGNSFAISALFSSSNPAKAQATMTPFSVSSEGSITAYNPVAIWSNTSQQSVSTTSFSHVPGTGKVLGAGHNAYPGGGNRFGYFYARLQNGSVSNVGYAADGVSHYTNGCFGGIAVPGGFTALYPGYQQSDSKARTMKVDYSGSTPTVTAHDLSSNTSTNYVTPFISQPGVSNPGIGGISSFSTSASARYLRIWAGDLSSVNDTATPYWLSHSTSIAFVLSNGNVALYSQYINRLYSSPSSYIEIDNSFPATLHLCNSGRFESVGQDIWVGYDFQGRFVYLLRINPTTGEPEIIDSHDVSLAVGPSSSTSYIQMFTAGNNHEFLVFMPSHNGSLQTITVIDNPLSIPTEA